MTENYKNFSLKIKNDEYSFINDLEFDEYYKEIFDYKQDLFDCKNQAKIFLGILKKCCFCGEEDRKKMNQEIHVIPASFGNKKLFSNEECNKCNNEYGIKYESNLSEMFSAQKVFSSIPKRKGFPKIKIPNTKSSIQAEKQAFIRLYTYEGESIFNVERISDNSSIITIPSAPYYPIKAIKSIVHTLWLVLNQEKRNKYRGILDWLNDKKEIFPIFYSVGLIPTTVTTSIRFTVWEKIKDNKNLTDLIIKFSFGNTFVFLEIPDFKNNIYLPGILPNINLSPFPPYEPLIKTYTIENDSQYRPEVTNYTISHKKVTKTKINSKFEVDNFTNPSSYLDKDESEFSKVDYSFPLPISLEIKQNSDSIFISHTYLTFEYINIDAISKSLKSYSILIQDGMLSGKLKIEKSLEDSEKINFSYKLNLDSENLLFVKNTINFFLYFLTGGNLLIKTFDPKLEYFNLEAIKNNITNNIEEKKQELLYYLDFFENMEVINNKFNKKIFLSKKLTSGDHESINILGHCIKYGSYFYETNEFDIPIPKNNYNLIIEQLKTNHDNFCIKVPNYIFQIEKNDIKVDEIHIQVLNPELIFENEEIKILNKDDTNYYIKIKTDCIIFMIYKKAIENIESNNINQNSFDALFSLASIYSKNKNYSESISIFNKLLEINSQYKNLNYNIAITYSEINDFENTIKHLKEEINNYPTDSENSYIALTKCYGFYTEYSNKILVFFEEIASKYNALGTYKSLATIYDQEKKKDNLLRVLLEIKKIIPKEKAINLNIANLYYQRKEYSESITFYNKELSIAQENPIAFYNLACSYSLIGNIEASLKNLEKSISLDKNYIEMAKNDKDFENIKNHPDFIKLLEIK